MLKFFGAVALTCLIGSSTFADFQYQVAFTADGSLSGGFSGTSGDTILIPVYLIETGTQGGPNGFSNGLNLYGAAFDFNPGAQALTGINPVTQFNGFNGIIGSSVLFSATPPPGGGVVASVITGGRSAFLGTLELTLSTVGTTTIDLLGYSQAPGNEGNLNDPGTGLNPVTANASTFASAQVVTAVPEPGSLALLGLGLGTVLVRRRRR